MISREGLSGSNIVACQGRVVGDNVTWRLARRKMECHVVRVNGYVQLVRLIVC